MTIKSRRAGVETTNCTHIRANNYEVMTKADKFVIIFEDDGGAHNMLVSPDGIIMVNNPLFQEYTVVIQKFISTEPGNNWFVIVGTSPGSHTLPSVYIGVEVGMGVYSMNRLCSASTGVVGLGKYYGTKVLFMCDHTLIARHFPIGQDYYDRPVSLPESIELNGIKLFTVQDNSTMQYIPLLIVLDRCGDLFYTMYNETQVHWTKFEVSNVVYFDVCMSASSDN